MKQNTKGRYIRKDVDNCRQCGDYGPIQDRVQGLCYECAVKAPEKKAPPLCSVCGKMARKGSDMCRSCAKAAVAPTPTIPVVSGNLKTWAEPKKSKPVKPKKHKPKGTPRLGKDPTFIKFRKKPAIPTCCHEEMRRIGVRIKARDKEICRENVFVCDKCGHHNWTKIERVEG